MKVYDGFLFNDELDLLELRLRTLEDVVDVFVISEFPVNFQQKPKRYVYEENKPRFAQWRQKIRTVHPKEYPTGPHPIIEHEQRRRISGGFFDADPNDWLIVSDVDEIPDPEVVSMLARSPIDHPTTLVQHHYNYYVNCRVPIHWPGPVIFPRSAVKEIDCEKIRQNRHHFPRVQGGWHFSWLGSTAQIASKLRDIDCEADIKLYKSHDMVAPEPTETEFLDKCRDEGRDLFGRAMHFEFVGIDPGVLQPLGIKEWLLEHPHYVKYAAMAQ